MPSFTAPEQQLITALNWFRSRYALFLDLDPERPATREAIEAFGATWIGTFKADWTGAFDSLLAKGIMTLNDVEYAFTASGEEAARQVEAENPFFRYEYDYFFALAKKSKAHSEFSRQVYGMDLSQHGLIDQGELQLLIDHLQGHSYSHILDLGCGNGRITEYLAQFSNARFHGVDISEEAIREARSRNRTEGEKLRFSVANLNKLELSPGHYDLILSLDTLYYADDLLQLLRKVGELLKTGGRFIAYFSQWIMDEAYRENLSPDHTHLAKALKTTGFSYQIHDLTDSGIRHWKTKLAVLETMRDAFAAEGNSALWDYRYREALRYANWGDRKYSRFFYLCDPGY
jgi:SAM-dependent methyltransferase